VKLFINGVEKKLKGLKPSKDDEVCDKSIHYDLTFPNYGTYTIKVEATNDQGTATETRVIQVARNIAVSKKAPANTHLFVVAIDEYQHWQSLNTPKNDAEKLIKTLTQKYQFKSSNVIKLYNEAATRTNILDNLYRLSQEIPAEDDILIYYAGHGFYDADNQTGYWIPANAPKTSYSSQFISYDELKRQLCNFKCQNVYLIADACYSGSFFKTIKSEIPPDDIKKYVENVQNYPSRRALASGGVEVVDDSDINQPNHSPFALALLDVLDNFEHEALPASILETYITVKVQSKTTQRPNASPIRSCGISDKANKGEFVFRKK
jgi:cupin superfamily acireductone dioxygenase involved in methionine salvage